jgi:hypothetical protein
MSVALDLTASYLRSQNFRPLHAGDHYDMEFTAKQAGIALNLKRVWLTIKRTEDDPDSAALLRFLRFDSEDASEIEITDAGAGQFTAKFTPSRTSAIPGLWPYDIQVETTDDEIITMARGHIELLGHSTRATA